MRYVEVEVSGKTYEVKETLKRLGLRWDGDEKVWKGVVNENALWELTELADEHPIEIKTRDIRDIKTSIRRHNDGYVRCWACGRLVPKWQATRDVNGEWYCGC